MPRATEPPESANPVAEALRREYVANGAEPFADVYLRSGVDGQRVPAARVLLSLVSSFFRDLFNNKDFSAGSLGEVEISQFDGPTVSSFVEFCYTGETALFRGFRETKSGWGAEAAAGQDSNESRIAVDAASSIVKLALAGEFFDVLDLTERSTP